MDSHTPGDEINTSAWIQWGRFEDVAWYAYVKLPSYVWGIEPHRCKYGWLQRVVTYDSELGFQLQHWRIK